MCVSNDLRDLPFANGSRQDRFDDKPKSEDPAEHYSSIPITQLVSILDAAKSKPERGIPECTANNDAREAF